MQEKEKEIIYKYLISYNPLDETPKCDFNGVMFLMKEPNAGDHAGKIEELETINKGNHDWFLYFIAGGGEKQKREQYFDNINEIENNKKTTSYYKGRLGEMLKICGKSESNETHVSCDLVENKYCLKHSAYANINPLGGGTKTGPYYGELMKTQNRSEVIKRVEYIVNRVKPQKVFVCSDVFRIINEYYGEKFKNGENNNYSEFEGVRYRGLTNQEYHAFSVLIFGKDRTFYEVHHPIHSRIINTD